MTSEQRCRPVFLDDPRSSASEAYRLLRSHFRFVMLGRSTVLVTSAGMGAGKSSVTSNLGIALAQAERSVLLVDADLRRPVLHTLLDAPSTPGLSSYLAGMAPFEAVVAPTSVPNLSLIPSGRIPPNPSDLLLSRRTRELLRVAAERYDVVLIDSPPVLAASDATTLASIVDGVVLVVGGEVPGMALLRAKEHLDAVHARILGAVVNQRPTARARPRAVDDAAPVPAAGRVLDARRAAAALGAVAAALGDGLAGASGHGLAAAREEARRRMAGVARAWALGRESARSGVTAVTARMAARGGPALGEMARQARSGVAEVVPAVARRLAPAGRGVATASVDVAARSGQGLRRGARAASRGLAAMIAACARDVERARRAAASLGAEVAQETRSAAQAASAEAQRGLGRVSRVAFRLRDTFPAIAGRGVRGAHSIQRRLGHAVSGLAVARRTWAEHRARAGVAVGAVSAALVERAQRDLGFRESPRRAVVTAVGGIATGLSLVLIATGVFHRPVAPRPGPAAIASVSALESPARLTTPQEPLAAPEGRVTTSDTVKEFPAGAPWSGSPEVVAPRAAAPVPPPSTPRRRPPHARVAGGARAGPSPSGPLEVVAIRFGVIDRQPPDWKWSWRVTVAKPDKAARVNARIEYIEFEGAKRRVVGYEELCGVPLTGGRLESIEGVRTISAEESRRISAVTATVSPASERADRGGCRATGAPVLAGPRPS